MLLRRIGVLSLGKFLACAQGLVGLLIGAFIALFSLAAGPPKDGAGNPGSWLLGLGVLAVVLIPLVYAILGFVAGIIGALIFNLVGSISGGIELEFSPEAKRNGPLKLE
jgi:hypothetical protein